MNRTEARLIAEEYFKIQQREGLIQDNVIGVQEVAQMLGVSTNAVYKKLSQIPHTKIGKRLRFFQSDIYKMLRRE